MQVALGLHGSSSKPVIWRPSQLINPHILISGKTGAGKTHSLRNIIRQMVQTSRQRVRVHVLDVHDDIVIPGASEVMFSQNSPYGLNPLVIDEDIHFGGVKRSVSELLRLMSLTSQYKMGDRQMAMIRTLLTDLYSANGFYEDSPGSWKINDGKQRQFPKKFPTVEDFHKFARHKHKSLVYGNTKALDKYTRALKAVSKKALGHKYNKYDEVDEEALCDLKDNAIDAFKDMMSKLETGKELEDHYRYGNSQVLESVVERFSTMVSSGIFTGQPPPFDEDIPVWRYRLKALTHDDSVMFVHTLLWRLFRNALKLGEQDHVTDIIILDETKRYQDDSTDNPVNVVITEGRKFGLCLVGAGQSHSHYSEDFISSVGTSILLQQDTMFYDKLKRMCKTPEDDLAWLQPRSRALIKLQSTAINANNSYQRTLVDDNTVKNYLMQLKAGSISAPQESPPHRPPFSQATRIKAPIPEPITKAKIDAVQESEPVKSFVKPLSQVASAISPEEEIQNTGNTSSNSQKAAQLLAKMLMDKGDT